jgi:cytochrome d ubiquinol oxidase subunit I
MGLVISLHILLPAFSVGLASFIAVLEGLAFFTDRANWARISAFWTRIFAVSFEMAVVSAIVMPFQIGANSSRFSDTTANVLPPLLAYEGLTGLFLEASLLGVLMFGRKLVPPRLYFFSGLMVAAGTLFSTFCLPILGWERDLADPRRRGPAGGVPRRIRDQAAWAPMMMSAAELPCRWC